MKIKHSITQKLLAAICCMALSPLAQAQDFNRTYPLTVTSSNTPASVAVQDIITDGLGNTITLSYSPDYMILTLHGFNGALGFTEATSRMAFASAIGANMECTPYKVIQRPNAEFIVVGLARDVNTGIKNPFAALFNSVGVFQSAQFYQSNTANMVNVPGFTRVNIIRTNHAGDESYIITAPAPQDFGASNNADIVVNAIRINGGTLNAAWNNKYSLNNYNANRVSWNTGAPYFDQFSEHEDYPQGLEYLPGDRYVIAGTTYNSVLPSSGMSYFDHHSFAFSVDNSGFVAHGYTGYNTAGYPFGHNLYYDGTDLAMSFTMGNSNAALSGSPTSSTASQVAVMKLNTTNLTTSVADHYYIINTTENYAHGITGNAAGNGYVIPVYTYVKTTPGVENINILEIDGTTMNVNYFHNFNGQTNAEPVAIVKNGTSTINYAIAGLKETSSGWGDLRIVSTDVSGITCGYDQPSYGKGQYTPDLLSYFYADYPAGTHSPLQMQPEDADRSIDDCYNASDPSEWKPARTSVSNLEQNTMKAYPTLFTQNSEIFTVELNASSATDVTIGLYSIDGRKISEQKHVVKTGDNTLQNKFTLPASGNYFIKLQSQDVQLNKVFKVTGL